MPRSGDAIYLRGKTWYLDFRHNGHRYCIRLGKHFSKTVARELARIKRADIARHGMGIRRTSTPTIKFEAAVQRFSEWSKTVHRPRTVVEYQGCFNQLLKYFSGKQLRDITPNLIETYQQARVNSGARVRANRELTILKCLFNKCRDWGIYEGQNPVSQVKLLKESPGRLRFLEPEEEVRLLNAAREPLKSVILLGIHTGLRVKSELFTLQWKDIDFKRGLLTVSAAYAKNNTGRTIPLNRIALETLKRLHRHRKHNDIWVFQYRSNEHWRSMRKAMELATKRAGLADLGSSFHVLRHTFASRLVMSGVDLRTVMELGGWKDFSMVQRYSHLSPKHRLAAIEKLASFPNMFHNTQIVHHDMAS